MDIHVRRMANISDTKGRFGMNRSNRRAKTSAILYPYRFVLWGFYGWLHDTWIYLMCRRGQVQRLVRLGSLHLSRESFPKRIVL